MRLGVLLLFALLATSSWAIAATTRVNRDPSDPGVTSLHPLPQILITMQPVAHDPNHSTGLELAPTTVAAMYRDIAASYVRLAPFVTDLPEYNPGVPRPDLPANDLRRQLMRNAIDQALGRAVAQTLQQAILHTKVSADAAPLSDPIIAGNSLNTTLQNPALDLASSHSFHYILGAHGMRSFVAGVDMGFARLYGTGGRGTSSRCWVTHPFGGKGSGMHGEIGVSSGRDVYLNVWLHF